MGYFLTLTQCGLKTIAWTSHVVRVWKSQSHPTRQPPIQGAHCQTHQIHTSRATRSSCQPLNESFQPRDLWRYLLHYFDWLFLRLKITLTYCSFDVLRICTVFWFQPSARLKFCFQHLTLVPTVEGRCPAQRTEDGGSFTNVASFFLSFFWLRLNTWHQDNPQRLGRDLCALTQNLCPGTEKRAEHIRERARGRWDGMS